MMVKCAATPKQAVQPVPRKIYIDVMRILAAFFVIFNHSGGYFMFPEYVSDPPRYWGYLFLSVFTKFAVPLFFAISGALLLNRPQEPLKKIWLGRIFKFALILFLGSLYAYLSNIGFFRDPGVLRTGFSVQEFVRVLYSTDFRTHYWYLYAYIAFLMVLPFLRPLVQGLETKYFYYLIALAVLMKAVLPMTEYLVWKGDTTLNPSFTLGWIAEDIVLFPCVGYFLEHRSKLHQSGKKVAMLWAVNVLCIVIACWMTRFRGDLLGGYDPLLSEKFHTSFDLVGCITVYITVRYLCSRVVIGPLATRLILSCSACSFGIYFFHVLVPFEWMYRAIGQLIPGEMAYQFATCLGRLLVCWLLTAVLKKIPGIKILL